MIAFKGTFAFTILGILVTTGCASNADRTYTCKGEKISYRTNIVSRTTSFRDHTLILEKKISMSALLAGETLFEIKGDSIPVMTAQTSDYKIYADNVDHDARLSFDLVSKNLLFSVKNSYKFNDYFQGRCVLSTV